MAFRSNSQSKVRVGFKKAMKEQEIQELKRSINFLDNYIIKYSDERDSLAEKLTSAQSEKSEIENALSQQTALNSSLLQEISALRHEIMVNSQKLTAHDKESKQALINSEAVNSALRTEVSQLKEILRMASEENQQHRYELAKSRQKLNTLFKLVKFPKAVIHEISDPLCALTRSREYLCKIPKLYAENQRLRAENQQLYSKIEANGENSNFKDLIKDSNGLSYLKSRTSCGKTKCAASLLRVSSWIPKQMTATLEDFNAKNDPVVCNAVMSLFNKLNQMWQVREQKRIDRIKGKHLIEMSELQKRINSNECTPTFKRQKDIGRSSSAGKVKESITTEYKSFSKQVDKLINEFIEITEITERNFNVKRTADWLIESLFRVFAEYTDKVLSLV